MAKGRGSWSGGKAPAQGGTPQKISRPVEGTGKFLGAMARGKKLAMKSGSSPLDGRKKS